MIFSCRSENSCVCVVCALLTVQTIKETNKAVVANKFAADYFLDERPTSDADEKNR